mgnify:CR=1 FL=1
MKIPKGLWQLCFVSWAAGAAMGTLLWFWCWEIRGVLK